MAKSAVFWDRDGTIIDDPGYLSEPSQVRLLDGAAEALRRLAGAGFENVIATNQSGIARGKFDEATLEKIHDRLRQLLADAGARVDAIYHCPFLAGDEAVVEAYRRESDLRKPAPGMLLKASQERDIDLAASWAVGDHLRDATAGRRAGCRTILVAPASDASAPRRHPDVDFAVSSLDEAVEIILRHQRVARRSGPAGANSGPATADASAAILQEILTFMKTVDRRSRSEDFSLSTLGGAIVQILALGGLVWGIFGWLRNENVSAPLLIAIVLQLMALTLFTLANRRGKD